MTNPNDSAFPEEQQAIMIRRDLVEKYPGLDKEIETVGYRYLGLTKREWLAGQICLHMPAPQHLKARYEHEKESLKAEQETWAYNVVSLTDVLLAELSKQEKAAGK